MLQRKVRSGLLPKEKVQRKVRSGLLPKEKVQSNMRPGLLPKEKALDKSALGTFVRGEGPVNLWRWSHAQVESSEKSVLKASTTAAHTTSMVKGAFTSADRLDHTELVAA